MRGAVRTEVLGVYCRHHEPSACSTTAKMEINKEVAWNPIKQDVKNGKLREYPMPSVVHYGAIAQTYEHPNEEDDLTGLVGDGDPVDVLDISDLPARSGDIYTVKVLGALAMKDDDAADWKIITIRDSDPAAAKINGLWQHSIATYIYSTRTYTIPSCRFVRDPAGGPHSVNAALNRRRRKTRGYIARSQRTSVRQHSEVHCGQVRSHQNILPRLQEEASLRSLACVV